MVSTAVLPLSSFPLLFAIPDFLHESGRRFWATERTPHFDFFLDLLFRIFWMFEKIEYEIMKYQISVNERHRLS
jgi:predicted esterase